MSFSQYLYGNAVAVLGVTAATSLDQIYELKSVELGFETQHINIPFLSPF